MVAINLKLDRKSFGY